MTVRCWSKKNEWYYQLWPTYLHKAWIWIEHNPFSPLTKPSIFRTWPPPNLSVETILPQPIFCRVSHQIIIQLLFHQHHHTSSATFPPHHHGDPMTTLTSPCLNNIPQSKLIPLHARTHTTLPWSPPYKTSSFSLNISSPLPSIHSSKCTPPLL